MLSNDDFDHFPLLIEITMSFLSATNSRTCGSIVVYYAHSQPIHIGVLAKNDFVTSKWGGNWLMHHPIGLVPTSYGTIYNIFDRLPDNAAGSTLEKIRLLFD